MVLKVTMEFTFKGESEYMDFMCNMADVRYRLPFKSCKKIKEVDSTKKTTAKRRA